MKTSEKSFESSGNTGLTEAQKELLDFVEMADPGALADQLENIFDLAAFSTDAALERRDLDGLHRLKEFYNICRKIGFESGTNK